MVTAEAWMRTFSSAWITVFVGLAATSAVGPVTAGPRTVLLGIDDLGGLDGTREALSALGGEDLWCFRAARVCAVEFPGPGEIPVQAVGALSNVRHAERDRPLRPQPTIPDPGGTADCPDPWEMAFIDIGEAWTIAGGRGEAAPLVAVMDSGFLASHEDLAGRIAGQYDYGNGDGEAEVEWSSPVPAHGTFMAGIIAADADDGVGRTGVIPAGPLYLQKIADSDGHQYYSYAIAALADLVEGDLGVRVLAYSLSNDTTTSSFRDAFEALGEGDVLAVVVAANCDAPDCADGDNDLFPQFPGSFPFDHLITVAGLLPDGSFNPMSHYGLESVDIAAPGASICSLGVNADDHYYTADGTSYAGPLVAGVAALMLSAYPDLTAPELARMLRASAIDRPELQALVSSGGVLSAAGAMATPMPRFAAPGDVEVDGTITWIPPVENAAAGAEGTLLLFHDDQIEITAAGEWEVLAFAAGEEIVLPDGSPHAAERPGALIAGPLPALTADPLAIEMTGVVRTDGIVTARLVATAPASDDLFAPLDGDDPDETGQPAWHIVLEVTGLPGDGDGDDDDGPGDDGGGCACWQAGGGGPSWLFALALFLAVRRVVRGPLQGGGSRPPTSMPEGYGAQI